MIPKVIAHRGASGYLPEHTLEAYALAVKQGADFIEQDLVPTKDGHLVCRHENNIADTTDVADRVEFADRRTTKEIDGEEVTGWFTEDFTLEELKSLRARGRNRDSAHFDGQFQVPTFQEAIDLARQLESETGRTIGIYPETKHPSYFRSIGLPLEEALVDTLEQNGYEGEDAPVVIQSFEVSNLRALDQVTDVRLAQLLSAQGAPQDQIEAGTGQTYADMATPDGLAEISTYADIVAPSKHQIFPPEADGSLPLDPTSLIDDAHAQGLEVHAYTFRAENDKLPPGLRSGPDPDDNGDLTGEVSTYFIAGLDGVFANHPDLAVAAREGQVG